MLIDHKWFALVISESSWETPDLEVLVAKKSWFNWVKAKEMGFDLEAACQDRLYLMSPRSCGQAFSRQKWSQDQVLLLCVHWSWGRLAGQCPGQQLHTAENCSRNEKWSQSLPVLSYKIEIVALNLCKLPCCIFFLWLVVLFVFVKWLCINSFGFLVEFVIREPEL